MLLNCGDVEDSWESLGLQGDQNSKSEKKSVLNIHWKDWCWGWNSSTLATWCKELTHLKTPWCWERLKAGGEGDDRGCDGWMASLTQWTWGWINSGSWWWTGRPGALQSMGSQRVGHDWVTELNWTEPRYNHAFNIVRWYRQRWKKMYWQDLTGKHSYVSIVIRMSFAWKEKSTWSSMWGWGGHFLGHNYERTKGWQNNLTNEQITWEL